MSISLARKPSNWLDNEMENRMKMKKVLFMAVMLLSTFVCKAEAVREGHEDEWQKSIILFVGENLGAKE